MIATEDVRVPVEPYEFSRRVPLQKEPRRSRSLWIILGLALVVLAAGMWWRGRTASTAKGTPFLVSHTKGSLITGGYSGWVGFRMTVGPAPLRITELGRAVTQDNTRTHTLKLVNATTGADVAGGAVEISLQGKAPGTVAFAALASPVTLPAGGSFLVVSSESVSNNTGDFFHDFNNRLVTSNVASIDNAICLEGGQWKSYGQQNNSFGPVDFRYVVAEEE